MPVPNERVCVLKNRSKISSKNASRSTNAAQRCLKNDAKSFAFSTFRRTRLARRTLPGNATRSTNAAQRCIKNDANPVRGTLPQCDIVVQISFEIVISACSKNTSKIHPKNTTRSSNATQRCLKSDAKN